MTTEEKRREMLGVMRRSVPSLGEAGVRGLRALEEGPDEFIEQAWERFFAVWRERKCKSEGGGGPGASEPSQGVDPSASAE